MLSLMGPLLTGALVGALFAAFDFPIPAPPTLAGVMGIIGIYGGFKIIQFLGVSI